MPASSSRSLSLGPRFGKKSLSFFLRSDCPRQFRLSLYDDALLQSGAMPSRGSNRPLSGQAAQAGNEWQNQVVSEVENIFGPDNVHVNPIRSASPGSSQVPRPDQRELLDDLPNLCAHQFVVESIFEVTDEFKAAFGLHGLCDSSGLPLEWSRLNPDIIQVLAPQEGAECVAPDGSVWKMMEGDERLRLRVIDVKSASAPGAHYFGEIAFYSMALASWLQSVGWADRFVVSARAAVWPGSYEGSHLGEEASRQRTGHADLSKLLVAMEDDLELIVFPAYAQRLARFFRQELPSLLARPWNELAWHPTYVCQNCDYLGYDWQQRLPLDPKFPRTLPDARHCWPEAEAGDLVSRLPGLTRGGATKLRAVAPTVARVAALSPDDAVWNEHSNLRSQKHVLLARARALKSGLPEVVSGSGACATIPSWVNLRVFVSLDYDPSSAITAVLSLRAVWRESKPREATLALQPELEQHSHNWGRKNGEDEDADASECVWLIESRSVDVERREFLRFLEKLADIFDFVNGAEAPRIAGGEEVQKKEQERRRERGIKGQISNAERPSTFQIFLWDEAQSRHLQRLIGRHLKAILSHARLKSLAWLFPAPQLLPDEALAGRHSPISLVEAAISGHIAVPVPHHYTLLEVVEHFRPASAPPPFVRWNYREPLSNLVPSERIHELWTRQKGWRKTQERLEATSQNKAYALELVVQAILDAARTGLLQLAPSAAPMLPRPTRTIEGVPDEAKLWYGHLRLNVAMARIEGETIYAMSSEARELRGKAARLTKRLRDADDVEAALRSIGISCGVELANDPDLLIYELSPDSRDVNMKAGEFGAFLSPRDEPLWALKPAKARLKATCEARGASWFRSIEEEKLTAVSVLAIDRESGFVALRKGQSNLIDALESTDGADFERDVMLDTLPFDVLSSKVKLTLERIGTPASSQSAPAIAAILPPSAPPRAPARTASPQPAHDFLFAPFQLSQTPIARDTAPLRAELEREGERLNDSQWRAWQEALEKRLSIIWGPPGTGKSQTLRAICRAALLDAQQKNAPLRLLITAHTYSAVDELIGKLERFFAAHPVPNLSVFRVQSASQPLPVLPDDSLIQVVVPDKGARDDAKALYHRLGSPGQSLVIVATVPQQLHNLSQMTVQGVSGPQTQQAWFDLVLLDESSQMDVANACLVWSKLTPGGSCVLAGDDLQMAPIHQAEPPQGQEHLVGSLFGFFTQGCGVGKNALNINYRSNASIVDSVRRAGYDAALQSHAPDLKLGLREELPKSKPADWPRETPFSSDYAAILDPRKAVGCFVYDDPNLSGQSNEFEAQSVAALLRSLWGRMGAPNNRRDENGAPINDESSIYSLEEFWKRGVGVVAPHRAQGNRICEALWAAFKDTGVSPAHIRNAVDTVERFQGQERDVIIASFGLGDPDMVALEDEFLLDLNRFNVLLSRAKVKAFVLCSRAVLHHLSDDQEVVRQSALLKSFIEADCCQAVEMALPFWEGAWTSVQGEFRFA